MVSYVTMEFPLKRKKEQLEKGKIHGKQHFLTFHTSFSEAIFLLVAKDRGLARNM